MEDKPGYNMGSRADSWHDDEPDTSSSGILQISTWFKTTTEVTRETLIQVAAFMISGPVLILLSKYVILSYDFPFPMWIFTFGTATRWVVTLLLVHSGTVQLSSHATASIDFRCVIEGTHGSPLPG